MRLRFNFQPRQALCLLSDAFITIFGGSAGGGKTAAICMIAVWLCLKYPNFNALILRKTAQDLRGPDNVVDQVTKLVARLGLRVHQQQLRVVFPNGSILKMGHLATPSAHYQYDGISIGFLAIDESVHVPVHQILYLLTRLRSTHTDHPRRAVLGTNPSRDSGLLHWVKPYVMDPGPEIAERIPYGSLSHIEVRDRMTGQCDHHAAANRHTWTFTLIRSSLADNRYLANDGVYRANLLSQPPYERKRLLYGDWLASPLRGDVFPTHLVTKVRHFDQEHLGFAPHFTAEVRAWDTAATEQQRKAGDFTAGGHCLMDREGNFYIADVIHTQESVGTLKGHLQRVARELDGPGLRIALEVEPGSHSGTWTHEMQQDLAGFVVQRERPHRDKETRAMRLSEIMREGRVFVLDRPWTDGLLSEWDAFGAPDDGSGIKTHDDLVDMATLGLLACEKGRAYDTPGRRRSGFA